MIEASWDPILFTLGNFQVGWHGIFTALAVAASLWILGQGAAKLGISNDNVTYVGYAAVVGGVVGARLFHVFDNWPLYASNPISILFVWQGGIAVYGAFVGAIIAGAAMAWRLKLPVWGLLDVAAPCLLVGQAIGRIGCLANGDAWGAPCDCPTCLCISYTHPNALIPNDLRGVPTYPYPFYEMLGVGLILIFLWLIRNVDLPAGHRFLIATIGYGIVRFFLTYLREETIVLGNLQEAQVVAIVTGGIALLILIARSIGRPQSPAPVD